MEPVSKYNRNGPKEDFSKQMMSVCHNANGRQNNKNKFEIKISVAEKCIGKIGSKTWTGRMNSKTRTAVISAGSKTWAGQSRIPLIATEYAVPVDAVKHSTSGSLYTDQGKYTTKEDQTKYTSKEDHDSYTSNGDQGKYTSDGDQGKYTSKEDQGKYTSMEDHGKYTSKEDQGKYTSKKDQGKYTLNEAPEVASNILNMHVKDVDVISLTKGENASIPVEVSITKPTEGRNSESRISVGSSNRHLLKPGQTLYVSRGNVQSDIGYSVPPKTGREQQCKGHKVLTSSVCFNVKCPHEETDGVKMNVTVCNKPPKVPSKGVGSVGMESGSNKMVKNRKKRFTKSLPKKYRNKKVKPPENDQCSSPVPVGHDSESRCGNRRDSVGQETRPVKGRNRVQRTPSKLKARIPVDMKGIGNAQGELGKILLQATAAKCASDSEVFCDQSKPLHHRCPSTETLSDKKGRFVKQTPKKDISKIKNVRAKSGKFGKGDIKAKHHFKPSLKKHSSESDITIEGIAEIKEMIGKILSEKDLPAGEQGKRTADFLGAMAASNWTMANYLQASIVFL